jgi:hypothetical protein
MADSTRPRKKQKSYSCRHAHETPEQRRERLGKRALSRKAKLALESTEERELRLSKQREHYRKTKPRISDEQKLKKASYRKAYYAANRDQILAKQKQYVEKNKQARLAAGREYWRANRERILAKSKLYRDANKEAISVRRKEKYRQESEAIKQKQRDYRKKDPQRYREMHSRTQKEWRAKNKDLVRAIYRRHMNKKRTTDVLFWLKCTVRERIACALSRQSSRKSDRTLALVGCTVAELARHLEDKFLPGMTWENRGIRGWHIDHIIPIAKFDLKDPEQQLAAFHYTNLQPLWAEDNQRKGTKTEGQNCFGFAYAARIADAASAKPKRRRKHGGQHEPD